MSKRLAIVLFYIGVLFIADVILLVNEYKNNSVNLNRDLLLTIFVSILIIVGLITRKKE